jgi:ribosomal protein S17E
MVKLSHHPSREEMKRLRERWDLEDGEIPLLPFDKTLTEVDDTVQHLRILRQDKHLQAEAERASDKAIDQLNAESKLLREAIAGIITTLNHKASKRVLSESLEKYQAKLDKRIDNIFKLVGALGVIFGILVVIKGH